jgi:hypothetical protein
MRAKDHFSIVAAIALVIFAPSVAHAQRGARIANAAPVVQSRHAPTRVVTFRPRPIRTSRAAPRSSHIFSNTFVGLNPPTGFGLSGFNGNGFDDIADQDIGVKAAIDPATQLRLAFVERVLRDRGFSPGFAGFFLLDGGGSYVVPEEPAETHQRSQPSPQVIVVQLPAAQQPVAQALPEPAPAPSAPLPDVGQFTLVLHDGKQIQAAAFTHIKDRIIYITPDGGRRSIAVADIDSDATVRVNQERGTPLQLPL